MLFSSTPDPAWAEISREAERAGVEDTARLLDLLQRYSLLLAEWNQRFNLTSRKSEDEVAVRHLLDSLTCARLADLRRASTLLDVGSGAGLPGLVLKMAFPHLQVTLLDSMEKKLRFAARAAHDLGLDQVSTVHCRAEVAAHDPLLRDRFDLVTARAVAPLAVLVEWTLPFVRPGGCLIAMKGPEIDEEREAARTAVAELGGRLGRWASFRLPILDLGRGLQRIEKTAATPPGLPRPPGSARRRPLGSPR